MAISCPVLRKERKTTSQVNTVSKRGKVFGNPNHKTKTDVRSNGNRGVLISGFKFSNHPLA